MAVNFNRCESDREVESVVKTIVLNFLLLWSQRRNITTADKGRELMCIDDWSGICGLKKVKCGNPSNLLWIAKYIGCGPINVVCVDLGKHYLCTLFIFPSVLMPRGQLWAKLLFCWAVTLPIRALLGSSKLQYQNFNQLLIKSLDGEAQSTEMDS